MHDSYLSLAEGNFHRIFARKELIRVDIPKSNHLPKIMNRIPIACVLWLTMAFPLLGETEKETVAAEQKTEEADQKPSEKAENPDAPNPEEMEYPEVDPPKKQEEKKGEMPGEFTVSGSLFPNGPSPVFDRSEMPYAYAHCFDEFSSPILNLANWYVSGGSWKIEDGHLTGIQTSRYKKAVIRSGFFAEEDITIKFRMNLRSASSVEVYVRGADAYGKEITFLKFACTKSNIVITQDDSTKNRSHPRAVKNMFGRVPPQKGGVYRIRSTLKSIPVSLGSNWNDMEIRFEDKRLKLLRNGKSLYTSGQSSAYARKKFGLSFVPLSGKVRVDDVIIEDLADAKARKKKESELEKKDSEE